MGSMLPLEKSPTIENAKVVMNYQGVEDETYSNVVGPPTSLTGPRLVAIWEGGVSSIPLPKTGRIVIGRSVRCDLRIEHGSVSREHAVLNLGPSFTVEDLGSSNGVRVNGNEVTPGTPAVVNRSSLIELGATMLQIQEAPHAQLIQDVADGVGPVASSESPIEQTKKLARLVAAGAISVIILGETGAGKEVLAKYVHDNSPRSGRPFLRINCAAFAESMVEGELFGHEKGSFTGAHQAKPGLLESAEGGTVLLDEVGELPLSMQAKLLRAIGNREVIRVGATRPRPINVRIIAATHRDLESLIDSGEFRSDLYFRLNGITLEVPPLRHRRDEILPFAEQFLKEEASRLGIPTPHLSQGTAARLLGYSWPGNIRELRSVIERAILLAEGGTVLPEHCILSERIHSRPVASPAPLSAPTAEAPTPAAAESSTSPAQLKDEVRELEKRRIINAIAECGGNQTKAAKLLGISRRALLHRLDTYDLPRPRKTSPEK